MNLETMNVAELAALAKRARGELWQPRIEVSKSRHLVLGKGWSKPGWYWCDRAENPSDQFRGPFKTEKLAWIDAISQYAVEEDEPASKLWYVSFKFTLSRETAQRTFAAVVMASGAPVAAALAICYAQELCSAKRKAVKVRPDLDSVRAHPIEGHVWCGQGQRGYCDGGI